jgi:hypothetical protein
MGAGCAMDTTLNYAIGGLLVLGVFAIGLAVMVW